MAKTKELYKRCPKCRTIISCRGLLNTDFKQSKDAYYELLSEEKDLKIYAILTCPNCQFINHSGEFKDVMKSEIDPHALESMHSCGSKEMFCALSARWYQKDNGRAKCFLQISETMALKCLPYVRI